MNFRKPQFHPFITQFTSSSGFNKDYDQKSKDDRWKVKTEEQGKTGEDKPQPLINLGLGIGGANFCNTGSSDDRDKDNTFSRTLMMVKEEEKEDDHDHDHDQDQDQVEEREECRKCSVVRFTEEQLEELKRQLLIFKYIVWGLPVPFQLILPIWRSFSSSSVPHHSGSSPILLSLFHEKFDYHHHMMDSEPGRCRRTDGKKWRCQLAVVDNEKYCEKHMHRGRKRSRKLVEASPFTGTPNLINLDRNTNPSSDSKPKFPEDFNHNNELSRVIMMRTPGLNNTSGKSTENRIKQRDDPSCNIVASERTTSGKSTENKIKLNNERKCDIVASARSTSVIALASGLDFSPKSVLQNGIGCPRVESCKSNPESERCSRTDGKKWRCKKEVVPYHRYCALHINRGKVRSEKPSFLGPSASTEAQTAYGSPSRSKVDLSLDTNLKISPPSRPADARNIIKDGTVQDDTSSTSTEATESDECTDVWDIINLSP